MDINYYSARRKLAATSLLSLEGVIPSDIGEILTEAKRLDTMSRFKEKTDFLCKQCVLLYTDEPSGVYRVAFESAVTFSGGKTVVMPIGGNENDGFIENVKVSASLGALATFIHAKNERYHKSVSGADGFFVNAGDKDSPLSALTSLYCLYRKYGKLKGLKVALVGDLNRVTSSTAIALSKCETALSIVAPDASLPDKAVLDYLSQFTDVACETSFDKAIRTADAVFYLDDFGDEYAMTDERYSLSGDSTVFTAENVTLTGKAEEARKALAFDKARSASSVTRAILSLLTEK